MGGHDVTTGLHLVRTDSGEPAPEVMEGSVILASSRGLGWDGVVAERGTSALWAADGVAFAGHGVVINLGAAPLPVEAKGPHGFGKAVVPPDAVWITPAGKPMSLRTKRSVWGAVELSVDKVRRVLGYDLEPSSDFGTVDAPLAAVVRALFVEVETGGTSGALFADELATALVLRLARHSSAPADAFKAAGRMASQRLVRVKEMIEGTLASAITVEDLASVAGLSPAHFARAFKRETNETPHAFVMRRRLERARELMASGSSIAEAALGCGFSDQAHLSRAFKLRFGITPGAFVRSARGKSAASA